ncbi:unnamed protein product [Lactuca virosa]|uniref:Hexosyltransferase n=1 Tax=Lactuca virosa TaxID=75947 RepID=A0AAU9NLB6_9ASTR|nr:unnamed protein product [Lactuca virosa]
MGVGYKVNVNGSVTENYWEPLEQEKKLVDGKRRRPYRIKLVGVIGDAYLAVIRGIRENNFAVSRVGTVRERGSPNGRA